MKDENHGFYLKDENNFNRLICRMKSFITEASQGRLEDFLLESEMEPETDKELEDYRREERERLSKAEKPQEPSQQMMKA